MFRAISINLAAIIFGLIITIGIISIHSQARSNKTTATKKHDSEYQLPTENDLKDHPIAKKQSPTIQSFDAVAAPEKPFERDSLNAEVMRYKRAERERKRKEKAKNTVDLNEFYREYRRYTKKISEMEKEVKEEMADELDELTVSESDAQLTNLDK